MFINLFELDHHLPFFSFWEYLSEKFGVTYLHDQDQPIIGIMPKSLHLIEEQIEYQRNQNFTYNLTNKSLNIPNLKDNHSINDSITFNGGYIFFISYDFSVKQFISLSSKDSPSALIGEYDIFFKIVNKQWCLFVESNLVDSIYIIQLIEDLKSIESRTTPKNTLKLSSPLTPRWLKSEYIDAFNKIQNYLYAGDCYQINLTQEFKTTIKAGGLASLLPDLLKLTDAPFAGYLKFDNFELLSCSPELFIEFQQNHVIKTRPIKGTLPRSINPILDAQLKQQLSESEKDQAENLMIVDLLRNDLSLYAETGSVHVPHLFEIESFAQVHHMVSEIQATLQPNIHPFDMLLSALPGGSITGAPKIRAMQIIDEIEGQPRGAYCGSLGYFNYDGTGRSNILIRSLQRYADQLSIWAGGGITVASNADAEYQECLDKVSALINYLNQYAETNI